MHSPNSSLAKLGMMLMCKFHARSVLFNGSATTSGLDSAALTPAGRQHSHPVRAALGARRHFALYPRLDTACNGVRPDLIHFIRHIPCPILHLHLIYVPARYYLRSGTIRASIHRQNLSGSRTIFLLYQQLVLLLRGLGTTPSFIGIDFVVSGKGAPTIVTTL